MKRFFAVCPLFIALTAAFPAVTRAADRPLPNPLAFKTNTQPAVPVVIVEDPLATEFFQPRADQVRAMVSRGIREFTGKESVSAAWLSVVQTNDRVAIKVFSAPGSVAGTRLAVAATVVEELLAAGLPPGNVIVWDKRRDDLERAGFVSLVSRYGVQVAGAAEAGFDKEKFYESPVLGRLVFSDHDFTTEGGGLGGRRSYVSRLFQQPGLKLISIAPLLSSNAGGTSGHLVSLATGAVDNTRRFEINGASMAIAAPEIIAQAGLGERLVLCITDALVVQYLGEEEPRLHYSTELRQLWFSRDPVALDTLALRELAQARKLGGVPDMPLNEGLYRNAALMELGVNDVSRIEAKTIR
jgi:hypothetical protein